MRALEHGVVLCAASWLFLGVSLWGVANQLLFMHSHVTPSGRLIAHAHPVERAGDGGRAPEHQRSAFALYVVSSLLVLAGVQWYRFGWRACTESHEVRFGERFLEESTRFRLLGSTRAPPVR